MNRWVAPGVVALLLALHAGLSAWSSSQECATHDEGTHLAAGIAAWRTGEHRLSPEHPPLLRLLAAIPPVIQGARLDLDDPRYLRAENGPIGGALLYEWNDERRVLRPARLVLVGLTLLGGLAIAAVARWLYGDHAALLALALFALSPDFLAHGHYVATDAGLAVLLFAATAAWWAVIEKATAGRFVAASILSGLAISAKFSALLLPLWVLPVFLLRAISSDEAPRAAAVVRVFGATVVAAGIAFLVAGAVYGFRFQDLLHGVKLRAENLDRSFTYLLGRGSDRGFLSYFPVSFAVKTPLPLLGLLGVCAVLAAGRRATRQGHREIAVLLPVIVYCLAAVLSRFNVGHRHLLPIYPFLFVLASKVVEGHPLSRAPWRGITAVVAVALLALSTLRVSPHFLSYLNEAAGGPQAASRYFADSSVDWGQDLPSLARWMRTFDVHRVHLGYQGAGSPSYEGIGCDPLPGRRRAMVPRRDLPSAVEIAPLRDGDWIAVNLACLRAATTESDREFWRFLHGREPSARAAYSFLIYRVDEEIERRGNKAIQNFLSSSRLRR